MFKAREHLTVSTEVHCYIVASVKLPEYSE